MRRYLQSRKITLGMAFCFCVCAGCSLFSPRESERPVEQIEDDYLNFSEILDGTREHFSKMVYEDLFHPEFRYVSTLTYSRSRTLNRLKSIQTTYDSLEVSWSPVPGVIDETNLFSTTDTVSLYRSYAVIFKHAGAAAVQKDTMQGDARFDLVYHDLRNAWTIWFWEDSPLDPVSFFSPDFGK